MAIGKLLGGFSGLLLLAGVVGITPAHAAMEYDYTLPSPGFISGTDNSSEHFTADVNGSGVTAAFGVLYRYSGPQVAPITGTNIYNVNTGLNAEHGGSLWGFEFSITGLSPSNYTTSLSLVDDVTGTSGSFDVKLIPDNATGSGTTLQNSETLSFASIAGGLGYTLGSPFDANADDTYHFKLDVNAKADGALLASTDIVVNAGAGAPAKVPEPASIAMLGIALAGLGTIRVLKKNKNATGGATPA